MESDDHRNRTDEKENCIYLWNCSFQFLFTGVLVLLMGTVSHVQAQVLPKPEPPFQGEINVNPDSSTPDWPEQVTAPEDAPNIVLVMLDDVGFAATSTFGGATPTPALDRLADSGLRYNRFHVTPMCAPTRAALLSGRNSHQVGFGRIPELAAGYPGYNSIWPESSASIAEVLKYNGYSTAAFGKWHNTPVWEVNPSGPFDRWPTGLGFEYFYGFIGYGTSQYEPNLYRNTDAVEPPARPEEDYHLTSDLADDAIEWLHRHNSIRPDKPFFLYFATGATHSPFHAPKEWVDKFKGKFDQGWDKLREETFRRQKELGVIPEDTELTPRPEELPAWDSFSNQQKKLMARQMEVYAGFLAHTDYEIGRLLDAIYDAEDAEDTIVIYVADDNGPTAEGGDDGRDALTTEAKPLSIEERWSQYDTLGSVMFDNAPAAAWAWAVNSPFKGAKTDAAHLGGTRAPVVISWPGHINNSGGLRSQFLHVIDIAPTVYEIAGIEAPNIVNGVQQTPLEGKSFRYTFDEQKDKNPDRVQYFEIFGSRGIYHDGWWAGSPSRSPWQQDFGTPPVPPGQRSWELYNLEQDFSQAHDLSEENPQKLEEMKKLFDAEARRNDVYPLDPPFFSPQRPSLTNGKTHFVYHEGARLIPSSATPQLAGRAHKITAEITIPDTGAEGVIAAHGGRHGGYTLYIKDDRVTYETSAYGHLGGSLMASESLAPGKAKIVLEVTPAESDQGGQPGARRSFPMVARLAVNGKAAGEVELRMVPSGDPLDIGSDLVSPVSPNYELPFEFTGEIESVTIDLL
ncbi:arylsulfatase [Aliifodinibius sp. S!AR15-10]|uniref:arylsulfatase n=1 Tax=Aliifodinibius sp. S!AR15-10 TaxID=2950437 RepID=UPI0028649DA0|nr:arylsulfatase [Aliifodinibius sp. S!AR15-10]MDR8394300.1 arylsulfatase [Aliifodinibius sp. S!AR15-10]